jgi:hypothetical protein
MKKIINHLFCALILLCAVGVFTGCQQETATKAEPSIVGTWICNESVSGPNKLVFSDSGAAIMYAYGEVWVTGTYSVTGNSAKIYVSGYDEEGSLVEYIFTANFGDTSLRLSIDFGDGPVSITYMKA